MNAPTEKLSVAGGIAIGHSSGQTPGTMRWTGDDFEGFDGTNWISLTNAPAVVDQYPVQCHITGSGLALPNCTMECASDYGLSDPSSNIGAQITYVNAQRVACKSSSGGVGGTCMGTCVRTE